MTQRGKVLQVEYDVVTDKNTFPKTRTTLTGTVSQASGNTKLVGVGTLFTSELEVDGWIYIASENAVRQVKSITDDLTLILRQSFPGTPTTQAFDTFTDLPYLREVTILNQGTADGLLQGKTLKPNLPVVIHTDEERPVQPIVYDASAANVEFSILSTW